jgi:multicomponent Na+:H+ antiporter subunit D
MFGHALGHQHVITAVFVALGLLTAVVGALFCFRERHLKRLLAFSTISHAGFFLIGIGLLTPLGLAGAAVYVAGHALVKAALFLCTGIVLHRLGSVNETALHGRGRCLRVTGAVFTLAAFGLADLPPVGTFLGNGWIEDSAGAQGLTWIIVIMVGSSILVGGAVLRIAGGVFYGLGDPPREDPQMAEESSEETSETDSSKGRTPLTMIVPPAILVAAAAVLALVPGLGRVVQSAVERFADQAGYNAAVLSGSGAVQHLAVAAGTAPGISLADVLTGTGSALGGVLLALAALYWRRLPLLRRGFEPRAGLSAAVQRVQSGVVNDYVTWVVVGLACLGGVLAFTIR